MKLTNKIVYTPKTQVEYLEFVLDAVKLGIENRFKDVCIPFGYSIGYDIDAKQLFYNVPYGDDIHVSKDEFLKLIKEYKVPVKITIPLNDGSTAFIVDDIVLVGCQRMTFSAVENLYKEITKHLRIKK